mmetsp:Transcript_35850/g.41560  ORF Transcript_35850/g.41560 Transcript_35850/m.41560 type:complete len:205 (+) Transcript_35850:872-1486(+)
MNQTLRAGLEGWHGWGCHDPPKKSLGGFQLQPSHRGGSGEEAGVGAHTGVFVHDEQAAAVRGGGLGCGNPQRAVPFVLDVDFGIGEVVVEVDCANGGHERPVGELGGVRRGGGGVCEPGEEGVIISHVGVAWAGDGVGLAILQVGGLQRPKHLQILLPNSPRGPLILLTPDSASFAPTHPATPPDTDATRSRSVFWCAGAGWDR